MLVGQCGVGATIDAYSLNACFFEAKCVPVLGAVVNRGALEGFYRYEACRESIKTWFETARPREQLFGVVPEMAALDGAREQVPAMARGQALAAAEANIDHVAQHVDVAALVLAAARDPWNCRAAAGPGVAPKPPAQPQSLPNPPRPVASFSRAAIEAEAAAKGAKGG